MSINYVSKRRACARAIHQAFLRSRDAAGSGGSLVDEMLGCAELRSVEPSRDPLYDALRPTYRSPPVRILLDTDVLLDVALAREPFRRRQRGRAAGARGDRRLLTNCAYLLKDAGLNRAARRA